jgi:putative DNA primase/helicase
VGAESGVGVEVEMKPKATGAGMQRRKFAGVWTPGEIWLDLEMSRTEKILLAQIDSFDRGPRGCIATDAYFAKFFNLGVRQVKRYIARLVRRGWIESERLGWNRRRLRATAKLRALRNGGDTFEGLKRPSVEGQKCPCISKEETNTSRSSRTQATARPLICEQEKRSNINCVAIPKELKVREQWVVWRWDRRNGKWTKPPYQLNGRPAKSNDPTTWVSFEAAIKTFESGNFDGVGFVLTENDPYAMADLDHCLDSAGNVKAWAADIVGQLSSYTERTPSGEGLRVIVKAILPTGGRKRGMGSGGGVELYDRLRYMTMTGIHLAGTPEIIEERQKKMAQLHERLFGRASCGDHAATDAGSGNAGFADSELLAKARAAKNGEKFRALYDHADVSTYPSASEADLALCGILAFWTGGDPDRIDTLFRRSALFRREKWDEEHHADGRTYGQATVAKAVSGTQEFYRAKT